MMPVTVLDVFRGTSIGEVAILDFPEGGHPKFNMILKRTDDNSTWKIIGRGWGRLASLTNAYTHLDPDRWVYNCQLQELTVINKIEKGDILFVV